MLAPQLLNILRGPCSLSKSTTPFFWQISLKVKFILVAHVHKINLIYVMN